MLKKVEIEAKTLSDATIKAREQLRLPLEKIGHRIIKEKKGILGIGASTTFEFFPNINLAEAGQELIEGILEGLNIKGSIETQTLEEENAIQYNLQSDENALLIGRDGRTLAAIQYLIRNHLNNYTKDYLHIKLDIGNYSENRKRQLEILATKTAKEVVFTGIPATLKSLNAYERRIVHTKLSEWRDVVTESEGDGPERVIVIKLKK